MSCDLSCVRQLLLGVGSRAPDNFYPPHNVQQHRMELEVAMKNHPVPRDPNGFVQMATFTCQDCTVFHSVCLDSGVCKSGLQLGNRHTVSMRILQLYDWTPAGAGRGRVLSSLSSTIDIWCMCMQICTCASWAAVFAVSKSHSDGNLYVQTFWFCKFLLYEFCCIMLMQPSFIGKMHWQVVIESRYNLHCAGCSAKGCSAQPQCLLDGLVQARLP